MNKRFAAAVLAAAVAASASLLLPPPRASAQADAAAAYQEGKKAFDEGKFEQARDLFTRASQTDDKNPEVFLWLGKADYQIGALSDAIAAWTKTQALAPEEPYSARMLKALRGDTADAQTSLTLLADLVRDEQYDAAVATADKVLAGKALTDAQRAKAMTLRARALLEAGRVGEVEPAVREVLVRFPNAADPAETSLLLAEAKLRGFADRSAEGVALLRQVIADHPDAPAAAEARFDLITFDLEQGVEPGRVEALAKWVADNPKHALIPRARRRLVEAYLALADRAGVPAADAKLNGYDESALSVAAEVYKQTARSDRALAVTQQIVNHLDAHYAKVKAFAAAAQGADELLKATLPPSSRLVALRAAARYHTELALKQLADDVAAGKATAQPAAQALPKPLTDVLPLLETIDKEFPAEPAWRDQSALADRVRQLAAGAPSAKPGELKAPAAWAVEIALPVVKARADGPAVEQAVGAVTQVINEAVESQRPDAPLKALEVNGRLLAALAPEDPNRQAVAWAQVSLLNQVAAAEFRQNVRAAEPEKNATVSARQNELIGVLAGIVARDARQAPAAVEKLREHLQPWLDAGQDKTAEDAYAKLAQSLPEGQRRLAQLAGIELAVRRVLLAHQRLADAGLTVPEKLDDALADALKRLYVLEDGLSDADPFLARAQATVEAIVNHYKALGNEGAAEAALKVKAEQASPAADAFAQFQVAKLRDEAARRELTNLFKQYNASKGLKLTPATQKAIDAYEAFITDHPADVRVDAAANAILSLIGVYEGQGAYDVAAAAYTDFANFAAKSKVLSQSAPGAVSFAERAIYASASPLEAKARHALEKVTAKATTDSSGTPTPPPAKISPEFDAALSAYHKFLKDHPDSPLAGPVIGKIMGIALEYARADAWDVADGIYASLIPEGDDAKGAPKVRDPERIRFCRGMCQIGKVMPDHAKEVLANVTASKPMAEPEAATMVAQKEVEQKPFPLLSTELSSAATQPALVLPAEPSAGVSGIGRGDGSGPLAQFGLVNGRHGQNEMDDQRAKAESQALAAISRQEARRAAQVAAIRDTSEVPGVTGGPGGGGGGGGFGRMKGPFGSRAQQAGGQQPGEAPKPGQQQGEGSVPVLSEAELARQQSAIDAAYKTFIDIKTKSPDTVAAARSRAEILAAIQHWHDIGQWERAADLNRRYLADTPADPQLHLLRLGVALDDLSYASTPLPGTPTRQAMLAEVSKRFNTARKELAQVVADFPEERTMAQEAQWDIAVSYITQARVVDAASPTLARGQYVRATRELLRVAGEYADHPQIGQVPQILWDVATELSGRGYDEEAISVWKDLSINYPTHPLGQQSAVSIAQTYQTKLGRPLRAAEVYLEINFARGGNDPEMQQAVFAIGAQLKEQKRWVEALHVLQMFVDAFPRHPTAGQALAMIGQIHQANEAWAEAIDAYRRVISNFPGSGQWVQESKWSIADCLISLSQWQNAIFAYEGFVGAFPQDPRVAEANRRIGILKDLANYQTLVDENGPKAFDAQFQMAGIVQTQLNNPSKAIVEYQKVATNYPKSHLADDALYAIGLILIQTGDVEQAREKWRQVAAQYPDSPLADDALFQIGKSYEDEAARLAGLTREASLDNNKDVAQSRAYRWAQRNLSEQRAGQVGKLLKAREGGKKDELERQEASNSAGNGSFDRANVELAAEMAKQTEESLTASQLADRQDKINAALRKAVSAYDQASKVPGADKAGEALLRTAVIYNEKLHDSPAAVAAWMEIVRQFSGTNVAEEASWQIAQFYERSGKYAEAVEAYKGFLRNYRRSPKAADAQYGIAENYEHMGQWIAAMDQYTNYVNNFPQGALAGKAKEQINFIKTYRL